MKVITKNLAAFSIGLVVLTIIFRFSLSTMLKNEMFDSIWMVSAIYGIALFTMGWIFGKKDKMDLPIYDIGFRFHLTTYIICNGIAEIWHLVGLQSQHESIESVHATAIYWGIGLLLHFVIYLITRRNAIKGIKKSEIFE